MSRSLHALTNFLNIDLKIKAELAALTPRPTNDVDESARASYIDQLSRALKSFYIDFIQIDHDFSFDDQVIDDFFRNRYRALAVSQYQPGLPQQLFQSEFIGLRPAFISEAKRRSAGYSLSGSSATFLAGEAHTINELLFAYRSQITDNEKVLQSIPPLAKRDMANGYTATLRGETSPDASEILASLPATLANDWTDIVAVAGHIIIMVRGRDHAFNMDIIRAPEQYEVNYYLPQAHNPQAIATLPGIGQATPDGVSGSFNIPYESNIGAAIADFIARIPAAHSPESVKE